MGSDMEDSRKNGGNRLFGTLIGGLLGMVLFRLYLFIEPTGKYTLWLVPLTFIGTVILIVLCQMFWVGGVQPGGVVLCILLFNTPVATYISYALNRILDTTIGVLVAWRSATFSRADGWKCGKSASRRIAPQNKAASACSCIGYLCVCC